MSWTQSNAAEVMADEAGQAGEAPAAEPRARVLVCDDSKVLRDVIQDLLEPRYQALLTPSAEDLLEASHGFQPDLIISDVNMDGMSGYELCQRVRAEERFRHVPFVLLTSVTDEEARVRGLECGADDYLYKPVRPRELLARVQSLLRLRQSNQALEVRSRELEQANKSLRDLQATLVQAEKLASLGTLVAGVSHEINNPLAVIKSGADGLPGLIGDIASCWKQAAPVAAQEAPSPAAGLMETSLQDLSDIQKEISEGARRIESIVENLRRCTATTGSAEESVDLTEEVWAAWKQCTAKESTPPRLEVQTASRVTVRTQRASVQQVLRHVLRNALQAAGAQGWVRASLQDASGEISVHIEDSGAGIAPENLPRVFDPFFTTRPPGVGVGLGLTVSHGLMSSLGGRIEAASPPGRGASFTLRWPGRHRGGFSYNDTRAAPQHAV